MLYCPKCDSEYQDTALQTCPDDGQPLVDRATWESLRAQEGRKPRRIGRLIAVAELPDRFQAQELARALGEEGIEAALSSDKAGTLGTLTTPGPSLFRISVAVADAARASELLAIWRPELDSPEVEAQAEAAADAESNASGSPA